MVHISYEYFPTIDKSKPFRSLKINKMKRTLHLVALLFISVNLFAQAPQKMSYQSVIRNASSALVTNAPVKMRISILQGNNPGTSVYSELHSTTTNANGLVSIEIGTGTSQQGTFSAINWGNGTYFLRTETDPTGGTNYSIEGTSQLLSVPYALHANCVSSSLSGDTLIVGCKKYVIPGIIDANPPPTLNNGLVGYWPFNGNANDESGNGNNGAVIGATLTTDRFGKTNSAYCFDGINQYIEGVFSNFPLGNSARSVSAWVQLPRTNVSVVPFIVSWGLGTADQSSANQAFGVFTNYPNTIGIWQSFGSSEQNEVYNGASLSQNVYFHLAVSISPSGYFTFYINSKPVYSNTIVGMNTVANSNIFRFGRSTHTNTDGWAGYFLGCIDDIRIYNRALTQEEITYLANDKPTTSTNTTAHSCGATEVHNPDKTYGTVTDVDGNTYKTIQIGAQTWMAENLKTTKYRNGITITKVSTINTENGSYTSYNNDVNNDCPYGKYYDWYAVTNTNQICPVGWHVPTDAEWNILIANLDPSYNPAANGTQSATAGGKMKSTGMKYWQSPNSDASNSSGFSGIAGGLASQYTNDQGVLMYVMGWWWSSTQGLDVSTAWSRVLNYDSGNLRRDNSSKGIPLSIRCIKD
jgi:uncharacterized protein (TIGR02145 family)